MGWLGWEPEAALRCDVNVIALAIEGREDMLKAIFGGAGDKPKPEKRRPMSASRFKAFAAEHNAAYRPGMKARRHRGK